MALIYDQLYGTNVLSSQRSRTWKQDRAIQGNLWYLESLISCPPEMLCDTPKMLHAVCILLCILPQWSNRNEEPARVQKRIIS